MNLSKIIKKATLATGLLSILGCGFKDIEPIGEVREGGEVYYAYISSGDYVSSTFKRDDKVELEILKDKIILKKAKDLQTRSYIDNDRDGTVDEISGNLNMPDGSTFSASLTRKKDSEKYGELFDLAQREYDGELEVFKPALEKYRVWPIINSSKQELEKN